MFCFPTPSRGRERKLKLLAPDCSKSVSALNHLTTQDPPSSVTASMVCHSDSNISALAESDLRPGITYIDELPSSPSSASKPNGSVLVKSLDERKRPPKLEFDHRMDSVGREAVNSSSGNSSAASADAIAPIASPESMSPVESGVCSPIRFGSEPNSPVPRTRYKLLHRGDVQVCVLNHTRTIVSKVLSSEFLRRWETHHIYLQDSYISSKSQSGFMENPVPYSNIEDIYVVGRWDHGNKYCIRLVIPNGSILFQASSSFVRDQWLYSIIWKKNIHKFRCILKKSSRPEVILKEIKNLVEFTLSSPVQDESLINVPIGIVSSLLEDKELWAVRDRREELTVSLAPLLEDTSPSAEMCQFFSEHCQLHPRSPVIHEIFPPIIHRILKRNVDFGKSPYMRRFVGDFLNAIYSQNNGKTALDDFIKGVHGPGCSCPHPRVLPNLVAVCLAAIFSHYEKVREVSLANATNETNADDPKTVLDSLKCQLECYLYLLLGISESEDWRPGLAQLLQPVPFPDDALADEIFLRGLSHVVLKIGTDLRCNVHSMTLGIRPGKDGWLHIYCPSNVTCFDNGLLWCCILETLFNCCCRRKSFLQSLSKQLGALLLVALRGHDIAQQLLCLMLEWRLISNEDQKLQIVTTLQSTNNGREHYKELCKRQEHLRELQGKGGPRKLTVPGRATDSDVQRLLSSGSFGNLECLSLAFTAVTSACAHQLIALPALRYLNLWATQFGDAGLILIAEHLDKLQVLNLCETQVTDKGIQALFGMTSLRKLNLNSTKLSLATFEKLQKELPGLQELDVRYTDAW